MVRPQSQIKVNRDLNRTPFSEKDFNDKNDYTMSPNDGDTFNQEYLINKSIDQALSSSTKKW